MAAFVDSSFSGDAGMLENLFQQIITDLKAGFPVWDDFINKAVKLHTVLRSSVCAIGAFLESMQKVADMALGTRGATSDLGSALTRLCMRQRGLEDKMRAFVSSILECLVNPLQGRMEEWKKMVTLLDKDHAKESKKIHQEMKKAFAETISLKKKAKKGKPGVAAQLDQAVAEYKEKYEMLETIERNSVRIALIEERSRFCHFINCLNPAMECQLAMLSEIAHVTEIINYLQIQSVQPYLLPVTHQCCQMEEWRKPAQESVLILSPGSPLVTRSTNHCSSSDGCQQSPSVMLITEELQTEDSSNGREEEQIQLRFVASKPSCSDLLEQPSSQTFPSTAKTAINRTSRQKTDHCFRCCHHCQACFVPKTSTSTSTNTTSNYAVPTNAANSEQSDKTSTMPTTTESVMTTPVTGYVNMNQLATLAVQQSEFSVKVKSGNQFNEKSNGDTNAKNRTDKNENNAKESGKPVKEQAFPKRNHEDQCEGSCGRSLTAEDVTDRALSSQHVDRSKEHFGKHRDLSLPPTFRKPVGASNKSLQTSSPPLNMSNSRGFEEWQSHKALEHRPGRSVMTRIPSSESPPPPPLPEGSHAEMELILESDYLPLPPSLVKASGERIDVLCCGGQQYSFILEEDNFFSPASTQDLCVNDPEERGLETGSSCLLTDATNDILEEAERDSTVNTFADSIRQGVRLRRTMTNDRSAPRIPSNKD